MRRRDRMFAVGLPVILAVFLAGCSSGQRDAPRMAGASMAGAARAGNGNGNPTPLYGDLGPHTRAVTTESEKARAYFNEGLLFMYAFGTSIAEESFRASQVEDPQCASCYWGEAWSLAPYLNGGMSPGNERSAHAAMQKAREHVSSASEVERALIDAFSVRFEADPDRDRRRMLDTLYAREMDKVAARYPDDLDVLTLQAEAWMLLRPRRGDVDLEAKDVKKILPIIETVLGRNIRHPGACHLYIHLVEASEDPGLAEACSDHLGSQIAVSHIHHMPTHIYMNIGRWGDAVRGNQQAWHADQKAEHGGPPGVYPSHNLHMLLNAAVMDGQSAVAIQAAKDLARHRGPWASYIPLTYAAFGRWSEILDGDGPASREPMELVAWSFSRGLAYLRLGHIDIAQDHLDEIDEVLAEADPSAQFRFSPLADVVALPRSILAGEILHARGMADEAIEALEAGVAKEDGLIYSEPRAWHLPVRHTLGAILLENDRAADAEQVYRDALQDLPNQGWAWFGLMQALDAQKKTAQAQEARREFDRHWARADTWLRSSRF
ncbi:tetratricopeptide repeat protein [Candidatus Palauibacter sp.]|uniref:tetratricopeptide repeat protein n=1 Tax=Candidatus Palauibacter sp. TaxID=3101350 RepID=UPI003B5263EE